MIDPPQIDFPAELRKQKRRLNLTNQELAYHLDVSMRTVKNWLAGQPPIRVAQEGALARLREVPTYIR
jgi:DNA-binding transcriptional regulator YiaG